MVKKLFYLGFIVFTGTCVHAQNRTTIPCATYCQRISIDSTNKGVQTVFQDVNLNFLRGSCNDSAYINSPLYNRATFTSITLQPLIDNFRRKDRP